MTDVQWGILTKYTDPGKAFSDAFEKGQLQNALRALSAGPNPTALAKVYATNPTVAMAIEDQLAQRADRTRADDFRRAESTMLLEGHSAAHAAPSALPYASSTPPAAQDANQSQLTPQEHEAWTKTMGEAAKRATDPQKWDEIVDWFVAQGHPGAAHLKGKFSPEARALLMEQAGIADDTPQQPGHSAAEEAAIRADPKGFLEFQGKRLDVTKGQLENFRTLNDSAMQLLGGVHDDATLQAAKGQARQLYQRFGADPSFIDSIPDTYSPEMIRDLQMRGMDTAKQLQAVARENRLNWDIEDDQADNTRADRATDSQIGYRSQRLKQMGAPKPQRPASPKSPTPSTVIGKIMDKEANGIPLTPAERRMLDAYNNRGSKGGKRTAPAASADLIGPVYKRGKVMVQYSKKAGKYVRVNGAQ
jgi:hypothetical protein